MANINTLLDQQVTLELESVDRLYLNGYIPTLQTPGQLLHFLVKHRGNTFASPALLGRLTDAWVAEVRRFAAEREIPLVRFQHGKRKEEVARPYLQAAEEAGRCGVVMIGVAQERTRAFRSYKGKRKPVSFDWCRAFVFVNAYYFYLYDREFGPAFIKISSYCPFAVKVWLNGHQWAKRQARRERIAFEALDNGFACCEQSKRLQAICRSLSADDIRRFFAYWMAVIPLSILQCELSLTQVFARPLHGREFFQQALLEGLALGRPTSSSSSSPAGSRGARPAASRPASSPAAPSRRSSSTTSIPRSASTSKPSARSAPRRRSTTRATSASAASSTTSTHSVRSASPPTDVCSTSSARRSAARSRTTRSRQSCSPPPARASPRPPSASPIRA